MGEMQFTSAGARVLQEAMARSRARTGAEAVVENAVGTKFTSAKSGVGLRVAERFEDGTFYASQDGETFKRGVWHSGAEDSDNTVWVEVWRHGTCLFHGCVDAASRCVTQVG